MIGANTHKRRATDLKPKESGIILGFANPEMSSQFVEIGCRPQCSIEFVRKGPGGKTLYYLVNGHAYAFRFEEAAHIILKY